MAEEQGKVALPNEFSMEQLMVALHEAVKLQSHYAELLNAYDGGQRRPFASGEAWIQRLIETKTIPERKPAGNIFVSGIVAARNHQPYVAIDTEYGRVIQLPVAAVRQVSQDMLQSAARAEADAMILKFFSATGMPPDAGGMMMVQFREFRAGLDKGEEMEPRT